MNFKISQVTAGMLAALTTLAASAAPGGFAQASSRSNPKDFTNFSIITERNIFDPNRRPVVRGRPVVPKVVDTFALTGTMIDETGVFAFFDGNNFAAYHKVLQSGGKIDGYTVAEITHDFVKLVAETNEVELKVGMQMRRSDDGKWAVSESSGSSFAAGSGGSRFGSSGFNDRNSRRMNGFGGRNNFRNDSQSFSGFGNGDRQRNFGNMEMNVPEPVAGDSSDPVVRMMQRRAQELGINRNAEPQPGEQVEPGGTNAEGNQPEQGAPPDQIGPGQSDQQQGNSGTAIPEQTGAQENTNGDQ